MQRAEDGSDTKAYGADWTHYELPVSNGRGEGLTVDKNGVQLVASKLPRVYNFLDQNDVIDNYYKHSCDLVQEHTGCVKLFTSLPFSFGAWYQLIDVKFSRPCALCDFANRYSLCCSDMYLMLMPCITGVQL